MPGIRTVGRMRYKCPYCESRLVVSNIIDEVFLCIAAALERGERVCVPGFGSFTTTTIPGRLLEFKVQGQPYKMGSRKVVRFRSSLKLKKQANQFPLPIRLPKSILEGVA